MTSFNIIAGLVTVASFAFSIVLHLVSRRKEAVEEERAAGLARRLEAMLFIANALAKQAAVIVTVSDRDETTKKEIKHLAIVALSTLEGLQLVLNSETRSQRRWKFGIPSHYVDTAAGARAVAPSQEEPDK